jgi:hypothetical protein
MIFAHFLPRLVACGLLAGACCWHHHKPSATSLYFVCVGTALAASAFSLPV